jgi:hypothetical protein
MDRINQVVCSSALRSFTKEEGEILNCFWKQVVKYEGEEKPTR